MTPAKAPTWVKPAAILSFHSCAYQGVDEASANFLNCQLAEPM